MGRKYKNPPIIEALCEFQLSEDTPWDLTVPGLFYEKLNASYPHREQSMIQEVELIQETQGLQQRIRLSERILCFEPDRASLIQLGPRLLVVNVLKPYPTWEGFKPRIVKAWNSLQEVVEVKGLERIGLRYINRFEFPTEKVAIEDYFEFYLFFGQHLPQQVAFFIAVSEFSYDADRDRCRIQLTPSVADKGKTAVLLDIHYFLAHPREVAASDAMHWVEEAHNRVEQVFEGCITDKLRTLLEEVV